jgi:uncharacterized protein
MMLLDANVLLYAYDASAAQHPPARRWLEKALSGPDPVLLPWQSIVAFLRIGTNPRAWKHPLAAADAAGIVDQWLARPNVSIPNPGERHWPILRDLIPASQVRGPLVSDAHLAALAMEYGAVLCTTDRDFSRFRRLRTFNPLD